MTSIVFLFFFKKKRRKCAIASSGSGIFFEERICVFRELQTWLFAISSYVPFCFSFEIEMLNKAEMVKG